MYGGERCLLGMLSQLDQGEYEPIVILPYAGPLGAQLEDIGVQVEIIKSLRSWRTRRKGVGSCLYYPAIIPFILTTTWRLSRLILRYQVDLVHTNTTAVIDGALAARLTGIPHVWHIREMLSGGEHSSFCHGHRVVTAVISMFSDRIIAVSQGVKQSLSLADCLEKVDVIYDGLEYPKVDPEVVQKSARQSLGVPDHVPLVGEVARLTVIKGYDIFIRAASIVKSKVPKVSFVGIGAGATSDEHYVQVLHQLVGKYGLRNEFHFVGYQVDAMQLMYGLDLFVLPSRSEAFGIAVLESMAAGKAVVATNIGGIPEIVEDGVTGLLVPPEDPEALAAAIIELLDDPERRQRMGAAGKERALGHFTLDRYVKEIEELYAQVLADHDW
jgi:glycosyltransferase involved in cell wall biosynthesis